MQLNLSLEDELFIMELHQLSSTDLLFLRSLLLFLNENNELLFKVLDYLQKIGYNLKEYLSELQDRGVLKSDIKAVIDESMQLNPMKIIVNRDISKEIYRSSFVMGEELFEVYPQFGMIGSKLVPLRGVAKNFDSLEDCFIRYGKEIRWSNKKHKEIIDLVSWAGDNQIINCTLATFVINKVWLDLAALRDGDVPSIVSSPIEII